MSNAMQRCAIVLIMLIRADWRFEMFQALQNALAPDVAPVVDFKHQWNLFLRYYAENKPLANKSQPVEKTHLIHHLNNMLKLLLQEQREQSEVELGPCLEYLIHHQILDVLSSLCQADTPPGLRPYIFNFFIFLLKRIKQVILPYVNVYLPVRRLLMLSATAKASPTETHELNFVTSLVTLLKNFPDQLSLFAHDSKPGDVSHVSSRMSSAASSLIDLSHIEELALPGKSLLEDYESHHLIISVLTNLIESADYLISVTAMNTLLLVCGIDDKDCAENAIRGTSSFLSFTSQRLATLFESIPRDVDIAMVEEVKVTWMEAHHLHGKDSDLPNFVGKSEVLAYFSWLDFCDDLVKNSVPIISNAIAQSLRDIFLENLIETTVLDLTKYFVEKADDNNEKRDKLILILAILTQTWVHVKADNLATEMASWLFGENCEIELSGVITHQFKHSLMQLCLSDDKNISLEVLSLFDVILERPCEPILQNLVLGNVNNRGYYNLTLAESNINSWSDEEDERERSRPSLELTPTRKKRQSSPLTALSRTLAPSNIARVINAWLYLVPDDLRTADTAKDSGYEQYVKNAQIQVAETFKDCGGFSWPREAVFPERSDSASSDSRPEADPTRNFYEGQFLETLLSMIESLLERDYEVNLQVTSILSKLAQLPHPFLHEYLLNPTIPILSGTRTLFGTMQKVLTTIKGKSSNIDQLKRKIYMCRKTLLGSEAERLALNLTPEETSVIDGLIIIEEFSKEIAAIALVKYHHAC